MTKDNAVFTPADAKKLLKSSKVVTRELPVETERKVKVLVTTLLSLEDILGKDRFSAQAAMDIYTDSPGDGLKNYEGYVQRQLDGYAQFGDVRCVVTDGDLKKLGGGTLICLSYDRINQLSMRTSPASSKSNDVGGRG